MAEKNRAPVKVSVMITTYNLEKYIEETLFSVLRQKTEFPVEILIGDDGSSDRTMEILERFRKEHPDTVRLFQMPRKQGKKYNKVERSAANRIHLWEQARGEYACFLDGDDYYISENRLQKMAEILDAPENQDCIMCAHNLMLHYEDGSEMRLCRAARERKITLQEYWPLMFLQANALLFRNDPHLRQMPAALMGNFDDNNITFWLFQKGKMYYLPECMGAYRQVEGSSWNANDEWKKTCSNLVGFSIEMLVAPEQKHLSEIRHYPELRAVMEHMEEIRPEDCSPFWETAADYELTFAWDIFEINVTLAQMALADKKKRELLEMTKRAKQGYNREKMKRAVRKILKRY